MVLKENVLLRRCMLRNLWVAAWNLQLLNISAKYQYTEREEMWQQVHNCLNLSEGSGEGNGNPLQCSCLESPRAGGAWWAAVYGVAQSPTDWSDLAAAAGEGSMGSHRTVCSSVLKAWHFSNLTLGFRVPFADFCSLWLTEQVQDPFLKT